MNEEKTKTKTKKKDQGGVKTYMEIFASLLFSVIWCVGILQLNLNPLMLCDGVDCMSPR